MGGSGAWDVPVLETNSYIPYGNQTHAQSKQKTAECERTISTGGGRVAGAGDMVQVTKAVTTGY